MPVTTPSMIRLHYIGMCHLVAGEYISYISVYGCLKCMCEEGICFVYLKNGEG